MNFNFNKITAVLVLIIVWIAFDYVAVRYGVMGLIGSHSDLSLPGALVLFCLVIALQPAIYGQFKKVVTTYDKNKNI